MQQSLQPPPENGYLTGKVIDHAALDDRTKAQRYDEIVAIHRAKIPPSAKAVAVALVICAEQKSPRYRVIEGMTIPQIAEAAGIGERNASDALALLSAAHVIERREVGSAVNHYGEEIPRSAVNLKRGDRWINSVVYAIPGQIEHLPQIEASKNTKKARERAAEQRSEVQRIKAELQRHLDHAACPHCHSEGSIQVDVQGTCSDCGAMFSEAELEAITTVRTEPANFADTVEGPEMGQSEPLDPPGLSILQGICITPSILQDETEEALRRATDLPPTPATMPQDIGDREILTGAATLDYLDGLGAALCLTDGKIGIKPRDDDGRPIEGSYQDMPQPLAVAVANVKRGAGAGMLTHLSGGLTMLDIDAGLDSFLKMFPLFANAIRGYRDNAPDRAKLLILMSDGIAGKIIRQDEAEPTRKAELLGRGHGNVAGLHPSGEPYKLLTGELLTFSRAQIEAMLSLWIPNPYKPEGKATQTITPPLSALKTNPAATERGANDVNDAIDWWIKNNQADVLNAVSKLQGKSKYVALRADDKIPSAIRTDLKDGYGRATFRDFGSNETLDAFEIHCRLNSLVKRDEVIRVLAEWRMATTAETKAKANVNRYGAKYETQQAARERADLADLQNQQ
jgi:hypothetical protein